ncbi:unnamed protein product [Tilletia controversa]|uniref:Uncharacterized protein n=1 Tax=Tilletia controversa TaxID=13291 RepID=A0A8X7SVL3_9BASI|nr:hypothetical protein A4X06_0g5523 [Tilletia controversa]CAD6913065.1 unnamed protein product [Tilletia controversa]
MATTTQMAGSPTLEREPFSGERSFDLPLQAEQSQDLPATPVTADRPSTSANPQAETPERPMTDEEKLEKAIRLENGYGLIHGSETQGVGLDARLKRAEKFMADQRVYTLLRRERRQTIKGKARESRMGQSLRQDLPEAAWSNTSSSLETTSTSRARIDRLEQSMSRIDRLEQGMSRVLELLEGTHGGARAGTGSRSTTSTDRTVLATPSAVTAASSPDTVPTAAAPRPSVTFAPSTPPIQPPDLQFGTQSKPYQCSGHLNKPAPPMAVSFLPSAHRRRKPDLLGDSVRRAGIDRLEESEAAGADNLLVLVAVGRTVPVALALVVVDPAAPAVAHLDLPLAVHLDLQDRLG